MFILVSKKTIKKTLLILLLIIAIYFWRLHIVQAQPEAIYFVEGKKKEVSFTFNVFPGEGNEKTIMEILNILNKKNAQATFFVSGEWIENNSDLARKLIYFGQEIGSYSYSGARFSLLSTEEIREDFRKFDATVKENLNFKPKLFRPPYGEYNNFVLKEAQRRGYRTIIWTINSQNWFEPEEGRVVNRVLERLEGGSIVLFYLNDSRLPQILSALINQLQQKEYTLVSVSSLID
ncbi:MAG: polysaccharide deacetylase family protein [Dethiobacteria bacterium]|jgi:peptidoglycan/xylan/chitin deacetylase (PgdA/CDA1 family)